MRNIATALTVMLVMATGCVSYNVEEVLLSSTDISLTWKGEVQVSYSPATHQLGYNDSRNEYRVYDDKLADWFVLQCKEKPSSVGQVIKSDISWTGKNNIKTLKDIPLTVEKTDEYGRIWLWNQDYGLGIIIKSL